MGVRVCEGRHSGRVDQHKIMFQTDSKCLEVLGSILGWTTLGGGGPFVFGKGLPEGSSLLGSARRSV